MFDLVCLYLLPIAVAGPIAYACYVACEMRAAQKQRRGDYNRPETE